MTRHLEFTFLWLQEVTKSGRVKMKRVPGKEHLADHLMKGRSWCEYDELIRGVGGCTKVSQGNEGNKHG